MSPEFGATATLFPIDDETLSYLRLTGRTPARVDLVERYAKAQGLWREPGNGPEFDVALELDLATVEPSLAGPRRPQDRVALAGLGESFRDGLPADRGRRRPADPRRGRRAAVRARIGGDRGHHVVHEHVQPDGDGRRRPAGPQRGRARASTSRPRSRPRSRRARRPSPATSRRPTSCGRSRRSASRSPATAARPASATRGPLAEPVATAIESDELIVAAVLSGNRNFEGRIHPLVRAVVPRLAAAGRRVRPGRPGRRRPDHGAAGHRRRRSSRSCSTDIWPTPAEVREVIAGSIDPELFRETYASVFEGDERWTRAADPVGRPLRVGPGLDVHREAAVLRGPDRRTGAADRHRRRPRAGASSATR